MSKKHSKDTEVRDCKNCEKYSTENLATSAFFGISLYTPSTCVYTLLQSLLQFL